MLALEVEIISSCASYTRQLHFNFKNCTDFTEQNVNKSRNDSETDEMSVYFSKVDIRKHSL